MRIQLDGNMALEKFPYPTKEVSMGRILLVVILLLSAVRVDAFTINF
jgi:hypothetical protein